MGFHDLQGSQGWHFQEMAEGRLEGVVGNQSHQFTADHGQVVLFGLFHDFQVGKVWWRCARFDQIHGDLDGVVATGQRESQGLEAFESSTAFSNGACDGTPKIHVLGV